MIEKEVSRPLFVPCVARFLVSFEPFSVDCYNEITCIHCVFVNTNVEMNLVALAGSLWLRDRLHCSVDPFSLLI